MHYAEVDERHRAKLRGDRSILCRDMAIDRFFQYGGRPPSWICCTRVWTTHEEYLVVAIDSVVSIICKLLYFVS